MLHFQEYNLFLSSIIFCISLQFVEEPKEQHFQFVNMPNIHFILLCCTIMSHSLSRSLPLYKKHGIISCGLHNFVCRLWNQIILLSISLVLSSMRLFVHTNYNLNMIFMPLFDRFDTWNLRCIHGIQYIYIFSQQFESSKMSILVCSFPSQSDE